MMRPLSLVMQLGVLNLLSCSSLLPLSLLSLPKRKIGDNETMISNLSVVKFFFSFLLSSSYSSSSSLCKKSVVGAFTFRAVLPSTNPQSQICQKLFQELECRNLQYNVTHNEGRQYGDVYISTNHSTSTIPSVLLNGIPTTKIRIVVFEFDYSLEEEDNLSKGSNELFLGMTHNIELAFNLWKTMGNSFKQGDVSFSLTSPSKGGRRHADQSTVIKSLSSRIAGEIESNFGWIRCSQNPTLAFYLSEYNKCVSLELAALERAYPLKDRSSSTSIGRKQLNLKRIESFLVAKAADIQIGDCVLDPLCGRATFLVESAKYWPLASYHGVDSSIPHLEHAKMNADSTKVWLELIQGVPHKLPFASDSMDKIMTCLPFGKSQAFYANLITELSRVLKSERKGRMILVIDAASLQCLVEAIHNSHDYSCSVAFIRQSFLWGTHRANLVIVEKDAGGQNRRRNVPVIGKFEWEKCHEQSDRLLWATIRSRTIPPLVPYSQATRGPRGSNRVALQNDSELIRD
jgi:tRNA G10  N-methylase Trm11